MTTGRSFFITDHVAAFLLMRKQAAVVPVERVTRDCPFEPDFVIQARYVKPQTRIVLNPKPRRVRELFIMP